MRPGLSIFDPKSLIPLVAAFFLSLYQIVTRKVSENDSSETSLFYTSILGIILMSFMLPFFWQPMQSFSYFLFLGVGFFLCRYLFSNNCIRLCKGQCCPTISLHTSSVGNNIRIYFLQ